MTLAFLPEIAAAAVALVAARAGDRLRTPFVDRKPCPETSAAAWSYEKQSEVRHAEQQGAWFPVRRKHAC